MNRKRIIFICLSILSIIIIIIGVSYSYFIYNKDIGSVGINTGNISINFSNVSNSLNNLTIVPVSDNEGKIQNSYMDFTINGVVDTEAILYEIDILPNSNNTLDSQYVKIYLTDQNDNSILDLYSYTELYDSMNNNGKAIYQELVDTNIDGSDKNYSKDFRLRIWIDENFANTLSKTFQFDIKVYSINTNVSNLDKYTFYMNDGRKMTKYYVKGEEILNVPHPIRDGYTFVEWADIANGLPNEYVRYEYVETNGAQYINSGYISNNNSRIKVDFMTPNDIPDTESTVLFFSGNSSCTYGFALGSSYSSGKSRIFYKSSWNGDFLDTNTRYNIALDKEKYYLNGTLTHTFSTNTFTSPYTLPFFAQFYQNTNPINFSPSGTRIYSIEIFENEDLLYYFVPVLNTQTNKVGFYDMVSGDFFDNLASGSFTGVAYSGNYEEVDEELFEANLLYAKWNSTSTP